jgi:uncharacterized protein (DUF1697 family)
VIHVAFLRAVNVGTRRVKMPHLVEIVRGLGYDGVWTHINSGNVVFRAAGGRSALERRLEAAFEDELGFEVTTMVRTAAELRRILGREPFPVEAGDTYFVTFLKDRLPTAGARALEARSNDFDTIVVEGRDVHWRMRGRSVETTIPAKVWEDVVGRHRSTSRNTNMLRALVAKLG